MCIILTEGLQNNIYYFLLLLPIIEILFLQNKYNIISYNEVYYRNLYIAFVYCI